jgi:hypothetical protein
MVSSDGGDLLSLNQTITLMLQKFVIAMFALVPIAFSAVAQCHFESFHACIHSVKDSSRLVKSVSIENNNAAEEKVEFSYVMTKDTQYLIDMCDGGKRSAKAINVFIYDEYRNKITSIKPMRKKGLVFICSATGIYYIEFQIPERRKL